MPSAHFFKPAFLRYQRLKYVHNRLLQTANYSICVAGGPSCVVIVQKLNTHRPRPRNRRTSQTGSGHDAVKGTRTEERAKAATAHSKQRALGPIARRPPTPRLPRSLARSSTWRSRKTRRGGHVAPAGAEVTDRWVNRSSVCCDAMPPVIYLPQWVCVYIGAGVGGVVVVGGADHSARSHFAAVWNPELKRVAFL